jgi:hypothetical protein
VTRRTPRSCGRSCWHGWMRSAWGSCKTSSGSFLQPCMIYALRNCVVHYFRRINATFYEEGEDEGGHS